MSVSDEFRRINITNPLPYDPAEILVMPDGGVYITNGSNPQGTVLYPNEYGDYGNGYFLPVMETHLPNEKEGSDPGGMTGASMQIGPDGNVWKMGGHPEQSGEYDIVRYDYRSKKHRVWRNFGGVRHQGSQGNIRFNDGRLGKISPGFATIDPVTLAPILNTNPPQGQLNALGSIEAGWAKTPYGFVHFDNNFNWLSHATWARPSWSKADNNFGQISSGTFPLFDYTPTKWLNYRLTSNRMGVETTKEIEFAAVIWHPLSQRVLYLCQFGEIVGFNPQDDSVELLTHVDLKDIKRFHLYSSTWQIVPQSNKTIGQIKNDGYIDLVVYFPPNTNFPNATYQSHWFTPNVTNITIPTNFNGRCARFICGSLPVLLNGNQVTTNTPLNNGDIIRVSLQSLFFGDETDIPIFCGINYSTSNPRFFNTFVQQEGFAGVTPQGKAIFGSVSPYYFVIWDGSSNAEAPISGIDPRTSNLDYLISDLSAPFGKTWLHDGTLLLVKSKTIWQPSGEPLQSQKPIIDNFPDKVTQGSKYQISGRQLWGTHVGLHQNDDWGLDCNHPIITLNAPDGRVYFCPWSNSSSASITPLTPSTIDVDIPEVVPNGKYTLRCSSAGNVSEEREVTVTSSIGGGISINQYY